MKRFWILFIGLSLVILGVFALWGNGMEAFLDPDRTVGLLRQAPLLAGPAGAALLISDIVLPIPTTVIIGALGVVLGPVAGAFWGWVGLMLAGWAGYGLGRGGGRITPSRFLPEEEAERYRHLLNRKGGLAIVISRMLPILPEVLSIMAGLIRMHPLRFGVALTLGSIPPAVIYAWIGATAQETPWLAAGLLIGVTSAGWLGYLKASNRLGASRT